MDRRSTHKYVKAHALQRQYLTTQVRGLDQQDVVFNLFLISPKELEVVFLDKIYPEYLDLPIF